MFTEEDIMNAIKQASTEVTDDCAYSGVLTLGAIILGKSEDTLVNLLENEDN